MSLNEELKKRVIDELLVEGIDGPWVAASAIPTQLHAAAGMVGDNKPMTLSEYTKWHKELERLKTLHLAKSERLEVQLSHAREELKGYERETDDLRSKLRVQEALQVALGNETVPLAAGLCLKCTTNEAVLPATFANQKKTIEKITSERDDLMSRLTEMRTRLEDFKSKDELIYEQVKKSVEMVEQAQLEQTQALIEKEQLKEELIDIRQRMSEHVEQVTARLQQERDDARAESNTERDQLNIQIKELTESMMENQNLLDKTTRDKMSLTAELESIKENVIANEYGKTTGSMQMTVTTAALERDSAVRELKRLYQEMDQQTTEIMNGNA